MEPIFAHGCAGKLVLRMQRALSKAPHELLRPEAVTGQFDDDTRLAVRQLQAKLKLRVTGVVNAALWKTITNEEWPEPFLRALQLLGAFEGHGYTKAAGNYDGAGMTWGIAGFTLIWKEVKKDPKKKKDEIVYHSNSLHACLTRVFAQQRDVALAAFGENRATLLEKTLELAPEKQYEFAKSITDPKNSGQLIEEWQEGFAALGLSEDVQKIEEDVAREWYWNKSAKIAADFDALGMMSDQTRQLCFEVLVNPGGFTDDIRGEAKKRIESLPADTSLPVKLMEIAKLFVERAAEGNKDDIRQRKTAIATGYGKVHGKSYRLASWGFDIAQPPLATGLRLAMISFDETNTREQLALAEAATSATQYVNVEAAVELREWWPENNGTELIESRTLSLRPLLRPGAAVEAGPRGDALYNALMVSFQHPVGILGLFGQASPASGKRGQLVFGRGEQGYAGIDLGDGGRLKLFRKRVANQAVDADSVIDIADIVPTLAECRLAFLYCGNGIPAAWGETSAGVLLRDSLAVFDGQPLVLGWFGNVSVPTDREKLVLAPTFFAAIKKIGKKKSLVELCMDHEKEIIKAWGAACHEIFGSGRQRFLWRDGPFDRLTVLPDAIRRIGLSGAGAIGADGSLWHARENYEGDGDPMVEVKP